jgi:hypothetical protein
MSVDEENIVRSQRIYPSDVVSLLVLTLLRDRRNQIELGSNICGFPKIRYSCSGNHRTTRRIESRTHNAPLRSELQTTPTWPSRIPELESSRLARHTIHEKGTNPAFLDNEVESPNSLFYWDWPGVIHEYCEGGCVGTHRWDRVCERR